MINIYAEACNAIVDDPESTEAIKAQAFFVQKGVVELLTALEAALHVLDNMTTTDFERGEDKPVRDKARAVIANAKGEAD